MPELQRLIYIDDEPDLREVVRLALELEDGLLVETLGPGTDAIARAIETKPDLIILDVMMPVMDGPGILKALQGHSSTCNIPVIFITAKVQKTEIDRFINLGALGVIQKPFNPMTLAAQVKTLWKKDCHVD